MDGRLLWVCPQRGRVQGLWHWEHSPAWEMPSALQTAARGCPGDMVPIAGNSRQERQARRKAGAPSPAARLSVLVPVTTASPARCSGCHVSRVSCVRGVMCSRVSCVRGCHVFRVLGCCLSRKQSMKGFLPAWAQDLGGRGRGRGQPWPLRRPQAGGHWKDVAPGPPPPPASWARATRPARSRRAFMESGAACAASDAVESSNNQEFDQGLGSLLCRHMEPL